MSGDAHCATDDGSCGRACRAGHYRHSPFPAPRARCGQSIFAAADHARSGLAGWGECGYEPNADFKVLQSAWVGTPANSYATIASSTPSRAELSWAFGFPGATALYGETVVDGRVYVSLNAGNRLLSLPGR